MNVNETAAWLVREHAETVKRQRDRFAKRYCDNAAIDQLEMLAYDRGMIDAMTVEHKALLELADIIEHLVMPSAWDVFKALVGFRPKES